MHLQPVIWPSNQCHTSTTEYVPGEVLQVDIKVFAGTSKVRKNLRAFGNYIGAFTTVDMATGYKFGTLIKSHSSLEVKLKAIRVQVFAADRVLEILLINNGHKTYAIRTWAALFTPPITLEPCIPHKHHSIDDIGRFNRTL